MSTYALLAALGHSVTFDRFGSVWFNARLGAGEISGAFIGEGQPIPVRRVSLAGTPMRPYKLGVISSFSGELSRHSDPTIDAVIRQAMADDTSVTIDAALLDDQPGSAIRPPGLLYNVTPITATGGGGLAALAGDLSGLAVAVPNAVKLVYLMNSADRVRALTVAPGLVGASILEAPSLPLRQVVGLDANDFASAEGTTPEFDFSSQATIHEEDTVPLPIVGGPDQAGAVPAYPTRSTWQTNTVGMRLLQDISWQLLRANRIATIEGVTW